MRALRRARSGEVERVEEFQRAAYARTEEIVGARAIPLEWDYRAIMEECEVWLDESEGLLLGVLILRVMEDELFLESISTAPNIAGSGHGKALLCATFERARELGLKRVGLITNGLNPALSWYKRMGFVVDLEEAQPDRSVIHMSAVVQDTGSGA